MELKRAFIEKNSDLLPDVPSHENRKIRGQQALIVSSEPELALQTLPVLLSDTMDRDRFLTLLERVISEAGCTQADEASHGQGQRLARISHQAARDAC